MTKPIKPIKVTIMKTLRLILENDGRNKYGIMESLSETCWHALLKTFFESRGNTIIHQEILKIVKVVFLHGDEKMLTNLFFKLNILPCFYSVLIEVYKNFVVEKKNNAEEYFLTLRKFFDVLVQLTTREDCPTLADRLLSMQSFKEAQNQITVPVLFRIQEETESVLLDVENGSEMKTRPRNKTNELSVAGSNGSSQRPRLSISSNKSREVKDFIQETPKNSKVAKIARQPEKGLKNISLSFSKASLSTTGSTAKLKGEVK